MTTPPTPRQPRHVVAIIGGAVAGSEAAAVCAEHGIIAVVIEQNERPFGKIEDGLPRWHAKLREKEYAQIGANLERPGVIYVPRTVLGRDLRLGTLLERWRVSAVLLASGAWRDRPLFPGADAWVGKGLVNQNEFVYWYNHYPDEGYAGPRFDVPDGAVVVGGGLASIDVVKIISCELYKAALAQRGIAVTTLELEHAGIPRTLEKHGLTREQLGVDGVTLYYRRDKHSMPLASAPDDATAEQLEKVAAVRAKVIDKVIDKWLVNFEPNCAVSEPIIEDDRLVGVRFQRTHSVDGELRPVEGAFVDARATLIVSSIGSIPERNPDLPMRGELIDFDSWTTGRVRGFDNVFGLGNVLTGRGNIKDSRKNAGLITGQLVSDYLGVGDGEHPPSLAGAHDAARAQAAAVVAKAERRPPLSTDQLETIDAGVREQWARSGYDGDYAAWIAKTTPRGRE